MKNNSLMKLRVALLVLLAVATVSAQNKSEFCNPILAGFYPDPSICGVGSDYYLVCSSFSYFPGIPIFQSKDLVNWKQIGHVMDRPEQLNVDSLGVSRGIFAPAIRYNKGVYYVTCTLVDKGGNFVVTSEKPEGPWSNPVWLPQINGIDPSLFFDDDGKAYIIYNSIPPDDKPLYDGHRTIRMCRFDAAALKIVGEEKIIVNGGVDITKKPVWIEAPHIFKVGGVYYLIAAEGGTAGWHSEVVFKSANVEGPYTPYEKNPILTQRTLDPKREFPVTSTGHADLVTHWGLLYLFACVAGYSHLLLDFTNSYGLRPLWPWWPKWYSWDIVFIVEPLLLLFLIAGLVLPGLFAMINREIGARERPAWTRGRRHGAGADGDALGGARLRASPRGKCHGGARIPRSPARAPLRLSLHDESVRVVRRGGYRRELHGASGRLAGSRGRSRGTRPRLPQTRADFRTQGRRGEPIGPGVPGLGAVSAARDRTAHRRHAGLRGALSRPAVHVPGFPPPGVGRLRSAIAKPAGGIRELSPQAAAADGLGERLPFWRRGRVSC